VAASVQVWIKPYYISLCIDPYLVRSGSGNDESLVHRGVMSGGSVEGMLSESELSGFPRDGCSWMRLLEAI